jgi:hypothetical protein
MALLTKKQINEILEITSVWGVEHHRQDLNEWNEEQPLAQFEPDWSKAPRGAEEAVLELHTLKVKVKEDKK